jgi:xanthine dehydrogenase YagS FAD-binding subunit
VAAVLAVEDGVVTDVRLAFGGLAPQPWRARTAEAVLVGERLTPGSVAAIQAELAHAEPLPHNAFKLDLATSVGSAVLIDLARSQEAPR